jgi:WD40 repeat protein
MQTAVVVVHQECQTCAPHSMLALSTFLARTLTKSNTRKWIGTIGIVTPTHLLFYDTFTHRIRKEEEVKIYSLIQLDSGLIITANTDNFIQCWDSETFRCIRKIRIEKSNPECLLKINDKLVLVKLPSTRLILNVLSGEYSQYDMERSSINDMLVSCQGILVNRSAKELHLHNIFDNTSNTLPYESVNLRYLTEIEPNLAVVVSAYKNLMFVDLEKSQVIREIPIHNNEQLMGVSDMVSIGNSEFLMNTIYKHEYLDHVALRYNRIGQCIQSMSINNSTSFRYVQEYKYIITTSTSPHEIIIYDLKNERLAWKIDIDRTIQDGYDYKRSIRVHVLYS